MQPFSMLIAAIAVSTTIACSGTIEGGSESSSPIPTTTPAVENAASPGSESDGNDPFFATENTAPTTEEKSATEETPEESPTDEKGSPAPTTPAVDLLVAEAAREVSAMKVSSYEHTTAVDEATGTFKYDCSGFVGYALTRVLPAQFAAVKTFAAIARPLAKHYEMFFESIAAGATKSGWTRVARAADIRPGDVVAWLKPAELVSDNTGHVMIVTGAPTVNPKRADEIIIPITDSSAAFHGPEDTRYPSADGLGRGTIGIIVNAAGTPIRYRWTGGYSTKEYSTSIAFARPS
jgi:hypothetical protein